MKGKLLKNKLLVQQDNPEEKTASGIIIPNLDGQKPNRGTVVLSNGDQVEEGDRVYFSEHVGSKLFIDEDELSLQGEFVLIDESQVLFIKSN